MSRRVQVTFDAGEPHRLVVWWCDLLGYEIESADELVSRLLQSGVVGEPDPGHRWAVMRDPEGNEFCLQ
jgi:hypothetical protein